MPSGPPELHEYWTNKGPYEEADGNAQKYLTDNGYKLTKQFFWQKPDEQHEPTEEENKAINYLCWEWDFGGIVEAR